MPESAQPENPIQEQSPAPTGAGGANSMSVEKPIQGVSPIEQSQVARAVEEAGGISPLARVASEASYESKLPEVRGELGSPLGRPGGFEESRRMTEEERLALEAATARGSSMMEIIRKETEPSVLREGLRSFLASEEKLVYFQDVRPWEHVYENILRVIVDRINDIEMVYGGKLTGIQKRSKGQDMFVVNLVDKQEIGRKPVYLNQSELEELYEELSKLRDEYLARISFVEAVYIDQRYAGSTEAVLKMLEQAGRKTPQAKDFTIIGNLSPTAEELKPFGDLVDQAWRLWVDLAENRRAGAKDKKTGENIPEDQQILNPFRDFHFEDNLQKSINFIVGELTGEKIEGKLSPREELKRGLKYRDAVNAAILAYGLFKATHMHLTYSVFIEGEKMGLSVSQIDATKAAYPGLRQVTEEYRDYPFAAGMPSVTGVFPGLIRNFFETISATPRRKQDMEALRDKIISLWTLWRELGVPLGKLPFDIERWREGSQYFVRQFPELQRDYLIGDLIFEGSHKKAIDIPWRLAYDYAEDWYALIYGMDLGGERSMAAIAMSPPELMKRNKPLEILLRISYAETLDNKTMEQLMQFTKITWLAGVFISLAEKETSMGSNVTIAQRMQRAMTPEVKSYNDVQGIILSAAMNSGFFSQEGSGLKEERDLFNKITDERRGFMPHELIGKFFTEEEVNEIYNSGAYDYNPFLQQPGKKAPQVLKDRYSKYKNLIERLREPRYSQLQAKLTI